MTKLLIITEADGKFASVLCNDEVEVEVLRRGQHDERIDEAEVAMEEVVTA